jgi:hypothetical protein
MVLNSFDHDLMLKRWRGNLHSAGISNCGVRNISITADLIGCVNDHHSFLFCQNSGYFTQHGGLANSGASKEKQALTFIYKIFDDVDRAVYCAPNTAGQADDVSAPVADGRYAVQGAFQPGAVIGINVTQVIYNEINI